MNTISSTIGQTMAMDGRSYYNSTTAAKVAANAAQTQNASVEVVQKIANNLADVKESVAQLQKLSDITMGHKLQFSVNDELGEVIVMVVDPKTNQVIKEIPSQDVQKMQVRLNKVIGLLIDEMI
jgi:Uncharacterized flagellar protein FlaG